MESKETMMEIEAKWQECLTFIKDNVGDNIFDTWFKPVEVLKLEDKTLYIQVPSQFYKQQIEEQYLPILGKAIQKVFQSDVKNLMYKVLQSSNNVATTHEGNLKATQNQTQKSFPTYSTTSYPKQNMIKNPFLYPGLKEVIDARLNPAYTFNTFIEGDCNKLARTAGFAVAESAGKGIYNPLFVYGKSGLGKTHLVQAIGAEIKERFSKKNVLYVDADTFENQYIQATIFDGDRNSFLNFYKNIDVLIIDDVQFFEDKKKTQDAFFQIFNYLHQNGKQIILTSDRPPVELQGLQERILNRFKWGLSAEISTPNFETRLAILKQKIGKEGLEINEEVIEYIANHITTNVRELEGVLISILAQATINKKHLTLDLAKEVVEKIVKSSQQDISIDFIKKTVCDYFNIVPEQLKSKTRKREIVQSRQIAMYFAKNYTKNSLASIGSQIGGKDHATVLHAYKTVNNLMETDKRFKRYILDLEKRFKLQ